MIATLAAEFGPEDDRERLQTFDSGRAEKGKLLGTVLTDLPDDELRGTRSLVVEDFQGERWLVDAGAVEPGAAPAEAAVVEVGPRAELARHEESRVGERLAGQTGRQATDLRPGDTFDGRYEGAVDLGNRRLAVIGNAKEFALLPWRAEIERHRGREMVARRTAKGVSWTIGIGRGKSLGL